MKTLSFTDGRQCEAGNIFCIGRNYAEHIAELGNQRPATPVVFLKPSSALLTTGNTIILPEGSEEVHYECELVFVLGSGGRNLSAEAAKQAIVGCAVGLDLTARDWQQQAKEKGLPWTMAKGFDGAACISDIVPIAQLPALDNIPFEFFQNGMLKQSGNSQLMLWNIIELMVYLSRWFTLTAGDMIYTGTPKGVGALAVGDQLVLTLNDQTQATFTVGKS